MQVGEYYVAGRRVPAIFNGMATGADWMSGASFVGMAGTLYAARLRRPCLRARLDRRLCARRHPRRALSAQVRRLYGAGFSLGPVRRQLRPPARGACADGLLLHLRGGADLCDGHHLGPLPRPRFQRRGLCRPRRHPGLLDARRDARRDLDPGRAVHRADHCLPRPGHLDVDHQDGHPGAATHLRASLCRTSRRSRLLRASPTATSCRSSTAGSTPSTTSCSFSA